MSAIPNNSTVPSVVTTKATLTHAVAILSVVRKLDKKSDVCRIESRNGTLVIERGGFTFQLDTPTVGNFSVEVHTKKLRAVLNALPAGLLTLEASKYSLNLISGDIHVGLCASLPDGALDLSAPPSDESGFIWKFSRKDLVRAIGFVKHAISPDSSRLSLTNFFCEVKDALLTVATTDTHRLCIYQTPSKLASGMFLMPGEVAALLELSKDLDWTFAVSKDRVILKVGGLTARFSRCTNAFADFLRVVPKETSNRWTVNVDKLIPAVKRALIVGRDDAYRIRFSAVSNVLSVTAKAEDFAQYRETVALVHETNLDIALNGRYIVEALSAAKHVGEGSVYIDTNDAAKPIVIRAETVEGATAYEVLMPMSLG